VHSTKSIVTAILSTSSRTEAAQLLGISRATLYRLLRRPAVQKELDSAIESLQTATALMQAEAIEIALRTLIEIAQSREVDTDIRINACREIFKHCGFASRVEIVDD
jgi:transposase